MRHFLPQPSGLHRELCKQPPTYSLNSSANSSYTEKTMSTKDVIDMESLFPDHSCFQDNNAQIHSLARKVNVL